MCTNFNKCTWQPADLCSPISANAYLSVRMCRVTECFTFVFTFLHTSHFSLALFSFPFKHLVNSKLFIYFFSQVSKKLNSFSFPLLCLLTCAVRGYSRKVPGPQCNMIKLHCQAVLHTPAALHMRIGIQMFLNNHFPLQTGNYAAAALPPRQVNMHHTSHICTSALPSRHGDTIRAWIPLTALLSFHESNPWFTDLSTLALSCRRARTHLQRSHACQRDYNNIVGA